MSLKIKISYIEDEKWMEVADLLKPILHRFKVKKSTGHPYKRVYLMPKNGDIPREQKNLA